MTTLLTLSLAALLTGQTPDPKAADPKAPRKPHPLAPSLPQLTDEEEARLDQIIHRFMLFDIGQLQGPEGLKAKVEFDRLGPEATFALIRGLNRAALIEHSCPAVVIAKKLSRILAASNDAELLEFARENIGLGVGRSRHAGVLQELRFAAMMRKQAVARSAPAGTQPGAKPPRSLTVAELTEAAGSERGQRLKDVLIELEQRKGDEVIPALGIAASSYEGEIQQLARELLARHLSRQTATVVKEKLKDQKAEVRLAAARVVGVREPRLAGDLIDLLSDSDANVRTAAQQALVRFNRGVDLGPGPNATPAEQEAAVKRWREWWARQR